VTGTTGLGGTAEAGAPKGETIVIEVMKDLPPNVVGLVAKFFGFMMPFHIRVWDESGLEEARTWVCE
jgi:hypothetical protein